MILAVYLGHKIFHPVAVLFFSKSVMGEVLSSQIEEYLRQKVVHLYRSTLPKPSPTYAKKRNCGTRIT